MKSQKFLRVLGFVKIAAGLLLMEATLTGMAVGEGFEMNLTSYMGLILFVAGILVVFISGRRNIERVAAEGTKVALSFRMRKSMKKIYGPLSKKDEEKIEEEMSNILDELKEGDYGGRYNLHVISKSLPSLGYSGNRRIVSADGKVINKIAGQKRRGTERYLIDKTTGKIVGIAYHSKSGDFNDLKLRMSFN